MNREAQPNETAAPLRKVAGKLKESMSKEKKHTSEIADVKESVIAIVRQADTGEMVGKKFCCCSVTSNTKRFP